ncbi:MAG TPA: discoidin domain-containing protein [Chitinispirillaceae bacterium]|nr:discoidin domain-containing protein [Chitinispirillaceae bacterium]
MRLFNQLVIGGLIFISATVQLMAQSSPPATNHVNGRGYLIIYSNRIRDKSHKLNDYIAHLRGLGASVQTRDDAQINPTGKAGSEEIADSIRSEIKKWYVSSNTNKFVLLIGHPCPDYGDVPMFLAKYPKSTNIATDFAYANMSNDWIKQTRADLCVGRIPVYDDDTTNLDNYLSRVIAYSNATDVEWRRNFLIAQTPLGLGSKPEEENYKIGESVLTTLPSKGWNSYRLYDNYVQYKNPPHFLIPEMVNKNPLWENVHCNESDFLNAWISETPGIVYWHAHGGNTSSSGIISSTGAKNLNDTFPAMVYAASCGTMNPRSSNNCGARTLFANAISYVGATETVGSHEGVGTNVDEKIAMPAYFSYLIDSNLCAAEALDSLHLQQQTSNVQWTMLYGCPEVALNLPTIYKAQVPQNFKAAAISHSQIRLSWDPCPGANGYRIQRSTNFTSKAKRAGFADITTNRISGTEYLDENLSEGTRYKYRIAFEKDGLSSGYSLIDSATTLTSNNDTLPPATPELYTPIAGSNSANLSWSIVPETGVSYNLKRSTSSNGPFVTIINTPHTTFLDSNIMNNTTYYYTVAAINEFGQRANSDTVSVMPLSNLYAPDLKSAYLNGNPYSMKCEFAIGYENELGFVFQAAMKFPDGTYWYNGPFKEYPRRRIKSYSKGMDLPTNSTYGISLSAANEIDKASSNVIDLKTPASLTNPINVRPAELVVSKSGSNQAALNWQFRGSDVCDHTQIFYKAVGGEWSCTSVEYPKNSVTLTINPDNSNIRVFVRTIKNHKFGEPDNAYSCSDLVGISSPTDFYEAEDAALSGGANSNNNHSGYSGTGFVDGFFYNASAAVNFTVNVPFDGNYEIMLRYSAGNGESANTRLSVNGIPVKDITCSGTANWDSWANDTEIVTLKAGLNSIEYKSTASSWNCINLDYITLTNTSMQVPSECTITSQAGSNGSITPSGIRTYSIGSSATYSITPQNGYSCYLSIDDKDQPGVSSYTFNDITTNHKIVANFVEDPCSGAQGGGNGLHGTAFGAGPANYSGSEYCNAIDGNTATFYDYKFADGGYTGLDFGTAKVISKIRYYPPHDLESRMDGGKFQGKTSNSSDFEDLYTLSNTSHDQWHEVTISNSKAYRWVRYLGPDGSNCNIAEMEFYSSEVQSPSNLTATAVAPNQINLAWSYNGSNQNGFTIERSLGSSGPWSQIATAGANARTYTDAQLTGGVTYWYRVNAFKGSETSDWSNTASATTPNGGYGNLSLGKTVTASSEVGGPYSAANVCDDNTTTRWEASSTTFPQWVKVDLGSQRTLNEVEMMFASVGTSGDCYDFKVETSPNNVNWTTQVNQNPNWDTRQTQRYGFSTTTARYVRITINGTPGSDSPSLYEFRVFGQ